MAPKLIRAMMNPHLNYFIPYSADAGHENQLTRALLVVIRLCPMAHQAWLNILNSNLKNRSLHLQNLPKAHFDTQRAKILLKNVDDGETIQGISVLLAPDAQTQNKIVEKSNRGQILDAIIQYGSELVVVVETKINPDTQTNQPYAINLHDSPVKFDSAPAAISWQPVLESFSDLVAKQLVAGAEAKIIEDFLDFSERHFKHIGPYSTLSRCNSQHFRLSRRINTILGSAAQEEMGASDGWIDLCSGKAKTIKMVNLVLSEDGQFICLRMHPGDTLSQAKELYKDRGKVNALLALTQNKWEIEPNLHWGFMASGLAWMGSPLPINEYCEFWIDNIKNLRQIKRKEWKDYLKKLNDAKIINQECENIFNKCFTQTNRTTATPRPGIGCVYRWRLDEATVLDDQGKFVEEVRTHINELLHALGESEIVG